VHEVKRGPKREKFPVPLTPPRLWLADVVRAIYANLPVWTQDPVFATLRCLNAFRRIPPARPAAIRRAFLLEELSYPSPSVPLSSGLGVAIISVSPDVSRPKILAPSHPNNPTSQVFFNEAGVALDASRRMRSPSSAYEMEKFSD